MIVTGDQGKKALEVALAIMADIEENLSRSPLVGD